MNAGRLLREIPATIFREIPGKVPGLISKEILRMIRIDISETSPKETAGGMLE